MEVLKNIKFDIGWKIATVVVIGIVQGTLAWIKIQDTAEKIERQNQEIKEMKTDFQNQLKSEQDKRATRVSQNDIKFDKLEHEHDELARDVNVIGQDVYYIKGKLDAGKK
jgi:uncharacterized protein HemX